MYIHLGELEEEEKEMFVKGMDGAIRAGVMPRMCLWSLRGGTLLQGREVRDRGAECLGPAVKSRKPAESTHVAHVLLGPLSAH